MKIVLICYVEPINLHGETNLKIKQGLERPMCFDKELKFEFKAKIGCEDERSKFQIE